jgi:predicted aldo/keto reductase-like oxidoreductase
MRLPRITEGPDAGKVDPERAFQLIRYAADHGVTYFDTAYAYHSKNSEAILGEALDGGYREKVKIATKQPLLAMKTQADIRRNLENTLKKLRTDYLDVYLIHSITPDTWAEIKRRDIPGEFERFRAEGLIRAVGFSYHGNFPCFQEVLSYRDWDMCQIQQNFYDTDKEATAAGIRLAGEKGCALVIMEPLRGGGLATPPAAIQSIYGDSRWPNRSAAEWAFRHLINSPEVSCVLSGMTTLEQLKENIAIFSQPDALPGCLSPEEKDLLGRVKAAYEELSFIPCTGCEYCLPCPQGVNIPRIFKIYNNARIFDRLQPQQRLYFLLKRGKGHGSLCVACGACEKKCPQKLDIIGQLKISHELLDGWLE